MKKSLKVSLRKVFVSLFLVFYVFVPTLGLTNVFAASSSTNDINRTSGWAHVNQVSKGTGTTDLEFISTRNFFSCFEYRTDGDISQILTENGGVNYNTTITDGLYPYTCRKNNSSIKTITANEYVEVRMVFGAESDERFDWTRFDVDVFQDTIAPTVPNLLFPTNNQFINSQDLYIDWEDSVDNITTPDKITYQYRLYSKDPNIFPNASFFGVAYTGTTRHPLAGFASGTGEHEYWYTVQAIDELGNESGFATSVKFTVDNTPPSVPTGIYFKDTDNDIDLQCGDLTNTKHLDVYWDAILGDSSFSHYEYSSFDAPNGSAGLVERRFDTNYFNSSWWTVPREGVYGIQLRSVDMAGNKSAWYGGTVGVQDSCQFIVDWTAPTGSIDGIKYPNGTVQDKFVTNLNTPVILGSMGDDKGVKNVEVQIGSYASNSISTGLGTWEAGFSSPIPDGTHTIELTMEDLAGNLTTVTKDITIDTVAPSATHTYFKNGVKISGDIGYVQGVNELTFTGLYSDPTPSSGLYWDSFVIFEAQDDGTFRFSANGKKAYCNWRSYPNLIDLTSYSGESYDFTDCVSTLPDGNYYMAHHIYDNATRKDIPSINHFRDVLGLNFIVDNLAPVTTFETDYSGMTFGEDIYIEGISTDNNALKILYIEYKESSSSTWIPLFELHSGWGEKSYAWDSWWGPEHDGFYDIKAYATDLAGNVESSAYMYNVGFDRTAPEVGDINITMDYLGMYINGTTGFIVTAPVRDNLSGIDDTTCMITTDSDLGTNGTWSSGTYIGGSIKTCMFTIGSQPDNKPLYVNVSVADNIGNIGYGDMITRTSDSKLPTGRVDIEDNFYGPNGYAVEINGTADDTVSGVKDVRITIQRSTDNKYWNNLPSIFNWTKVPLNLHQTSGTDIWNHTGPYPTWQNGVTYTVTPYIWDNVHTMYSTGMPDSFVWDSQLPQDPTSFNSSTHTVNKPSKDTVITVSFSGAHDFGLSGVKGYYYSFSPIQETPDLSNWLEFDDTTISSKPLRDGTYYFNIRTVDMIGNITSTAHYGPFIIDTTPAEITWDEPLDGEILSTPTTLKASTNETMNNVRFRWKYEDGDWNTGVNNNSKQTEYEYEFNPTKDGTYTLKVQGRDLALNWSRAIPDITIVVDNTSPVLSEIADFSLIEGDTLEPVVTGITELYGISKVCLNIPAYSYEMCDDTVDPLITEYDLMQFVINNLSVTTVDTSILPIGIHTVEYYAYDIVGNKSNVMSTNVEILDNIPSVSILGVTSTTVGTQITLSTSITNGNPLFTYFWSGDCTGTDSTTTFTPTEARDYICTVQITDDDGDTTTETHIVTVGTVAGTTDGPSGSPTTTTPSPTSTNNEFLGTGGGDYLYAQATTEEDSEEEDNTTEEEEEDIDDEDTSKEEEVKGAEDEDTKDDKRPWLKYLLLSLPVFILLFLILRRRKKEEENQY